MADVFVGATFEVRYPFVLEEVSLPPDDPEAGSGHGLRTVMSWRPGAKIGEPQPPYGEADMVANGIGHQLLTVVSIHKPGKYPTRVFYTRRWRDPRGREFGKTKLHVKALSAFTAMLRGYRHEYDLQEAESVASVGLGAERAQSANEPAP